MEYEVRQTAVFSGWLKALKDNTAKIAIARRIVRLGNGNFGDSKSVGDKSSQQSDIRAAKEMAGEV